MTLPRVRTVHPAVCAAHYHALEIGAQSCLSREEAMAYVVLHISIKGQVGSEEFSLILDV